MTVHLVSESNFIRATRDAGYRDTASAVAELVDNSLQAGARRIDVFVREARGPDGDRQVSLAVLDDGAGMDANQLRRCLQFGGTERFDDRTGFGRFGMGLPTSSLSQSRRVDVFSWKVGRACLRTHLDVDEVVRANRATIANPAPCRLPEWALPLARPSGALVVWPACDRLKHRKAATVAEKLRERLDRIYFYVLRKGVRIAVNGQLLEGRDPLLRTVESRAEGAALFGPPLSYEIALPGRAATTVVEVCFSELPVGAWAGLPNEEKRALGILAGAGVSIVRLDREIDHGWLLMGGKRKENYDDWWRCQIRFSPDADELFGVTHTKQGVRPSPELKGILEPPLEAVARTLNLRVRRQFDAIRRARPSLAVEVAGRSDRRLPALLAMPAAPRGALTGHGYRIQVRDLEVPQFFQIAVEGDSVVITINESHPFFRKVYDRLPAAGEERFHIEALLLSAARAHVTVLGAEQGGVSAHFQASWGDALAAFLG